MKRSCLIVGAGMAGLSAGKKLHTAGWQVTILDKGRAVGGRMATRSFDEGRFDYGAQYFTIRDAAFAELAKPWVASGLVSAWTAHRFRATGGIRRIAETMAAGLDVRTGQQVTRVAESSGGWAVELESGGLLGAETLLLTAPVPQSLELLQRGGTVLGEDDWALLEQARYWKCLTVLARVEGELHVGAHGFAAFADEVLAWAADNFVKGVSTVPGCLTLHGGHAFSEANWDEAPAVAVHAMLDAAAPLFTGRIRSYSLLRWRYAEPVIQLPVLFHAAGKLVFAGDVFGGPRVGGAAISGLAAADYLLSS